jgi:hypothetical protein
LGTPYRVSLGVSADVLRAVEGLTYVRGPLELLVQECSRSRSASPAARAEARSSAALMTSCMASMCGSLTPHLGLLIQSTLIGCS